jgi:O-antigen/teichoic acid export membrane protein
MSKLVGIIMIPIITRYYTSDEVGVAAIFTSVLLIISPLLSLRYCLAIPLPKSNRIVDTLIFLCVSISFKLSLLIFIIIFLAGEYLFSYLGLMSIYEYRYIIVIASFFVSLYEIISMWVIREKKFSVYSRTLIVQSMAGAFVKLVGAAVTAGAIGLIIGSIVQNFYGAFQFLYSYYKSRNGMFEVTKKKCKLVLCYYSNYFYFKFPAHALYVFSAQLPIMYASKYYTVSEVGFLSLAMALIFIPISAISGSVSKVYFSEVSSIGRSKPKEIYAVTTSLVKKLFLLGLCITAISFILSPMAFRIALGEEWAQAGLFAKALSFSLLFQVSATTLITVLNVINLNFLSFFIHLMRFTIVLISFFSSRELSFTLLESIYLYSISMSIFYFIVISSVILLLRHRGRNNIKKGVLFSG